MIANPEHLYTELENSIKKLASSERKKLAPLKAQVESIVSDKSKSMEEQHRDIFKTISSYITDRNYEGKKATILLGFLYDNMEVSKKEMDAFIDNEKENQRIILNAKFSQDGMNFFKNIEVKPKIVKNPLDSTQKELDVLAKKPNITIENSDENNSNNKDHEIKPTGPQ